MSDIHDVTVGSEWLHYPHAGTGDMIVLTVESINDDGGVLFMDGTRARREYMIPPHFERVSFDTPNEKLSPTRSPKRQEIDHKRAEEEAFNKACDFRTEDMFRPGQPIRRKGRLLFTIGIARSGKSTWCTRWSQYMLDADARITRTPPLFPRAIVCSDDIRLAVHGRRFNKDAEVAVWMVHGYAAKALLSRGHDVVVDGTNTTSDSLLRLLSIDANARHVLFDVDPEECKERARDSGHDDLVDAGVIDRQYAQLCKMKEREGGIDGEVERVRQRVKDRWKP